LRRAALFKALALTLDSPGPKHRDHVLASLDPLAARVDAPLHAPFRAAREAWRACAQTDLPFRHARLFHGGTRCPPHETAYGDGRRLAGREAELADISGFYLAFGFQLSPGHPDLPDHLGTELEFVSLMLLKAALAASDNAREQEEITLDALRTFLECHLGRWTGAFREALAESGESIPYLETARVIEETVRDECQRLGAHPSLVAGRATGDPMQADELRCPLAERAAR
jgi:TorA maturation chaperone TorD